MLFLVMTKAAHEICLCGHREDLHSTMRIAGRRPCYSLGCPCVLYRRTLTTQHIADYAKKEDKK